MLADSPDLMFRPHLAPNLSDARRLGPSSPSCLNRPQTSRFARLPSKRAQHERRRRSTEGPRTD
jgi:hypothetical protein